MRPMRRSGNPGVLMVVVMDAHAPECEPERRRFATKPSDRQGYKSAIWAIADRLCRVVWKILHEGVRFIEQGIESDPKLCKHRARTLARALRKLGYNVQITPINPSAT